MAVSLSLARAGRPLRPRRFLVLISVRSWVDSSVVVRLGWLGHLKKSNDLLGNRTHDLPACSIVPQSNMISHHNRKYNLNFCEFRAVNVSVKFKDSIFVLWRTQGHHPRRYPFKSNCGSSYMCMASFTLTHSWSWARHEKPPIVQLLKNFPAFHGIRRFITVFTRTFHWFLS
jgi:hypothetical protein